MSERVENSFVPEYEKYLTDRRLLKIFNAHEYIPTVR